MMRPMSDVIAIAQEASPLGPAEPEVVEQATPEQVAAAWQAVDRNGRTMSSIGLGAAIVGPPVLLVGFGLTINNALNGDGQGLSLGKGLLIGGIAGTLAGAPLLAGGGLRSRKALAMQSGAWHNGGAGYATWALWGASFGLLSTALTMQNAGEGQVASVLGVAGTLAYGGAVVSGVVQVRLNGDARVDLALVPTRNGLVLSALF